MSRPASINLNYAAPHAGGVVPIMLGVNRDGEGYVNGIWTAGFCFLENCETRDAAAAQVTRQLGRDVRRINRVLATGQTAREAAKACTRPSLAAELLSAIAATDPKWAKKRVIQ
jgi:hypothetical protein